MKSMNDTNNNGATIFDSQSGLGIVYPSSNTNPMKMSSSMIMASSASSATAAAFLNGGGATPTTAASSTLNVTSMDGYRHGSSVRSARRSSLLPAGFMSNPIFNNTNSPVTKKNKRKHDSLSDVLRTAEEVMEMSFDTYNKRQKQARARTTSSATPSNISHNGMSEDTHPFDDSWFMNYHQRQLPNQYRKTSKPAAADLPMAADLLDVFGGSSSCKIQTQVQDEAELEPDMFLQALKRYDDSNHQEMMMSSVSSFDTTGFMMDNAVVTDNDDSLRLSTAVPTIATSSSDVSPKEKSPSSSATSAPACYKEEQWNERYQELVEYTKQNGHCLVKHQWSKNRPLAQWVKRQRYQYKLRCDGRRSTLTDERLKLLNDLNFVWSTQKAIWEEKYNELVEYTNVHGHCNVPSNYEANRPLAIWVRCQRRQYKLCAQRQQEREGRGLASSTMDNDSNDDNNANGSISQERITKLKALGFSFNPRNLKLRK